MTTHVKICRHCGKSFETPKKVGVYCSGRCVQAKEKAYSRRHAARFSHERRRAGILVGCAIAKGDLLRQPCEQCGSLRGIEAHHDDYARPLEVRWLCKSHHKQHHVKHGPGLNAFCEEISA